MFQLTTPLVVALGCSVAAFASICFAHDPALHNDNAGLRGFEFATHDDQNHVVGSGDHLFLWNSDWLQLPGERELIGSTHGCIVTDAANQIYMSADTGDAVQVFAEDGTFVRSFGKDWGSGVHGLSIVLEVEENTTAAGTLNRIETEYLYIAHTAKQEILKTTLTGEVVMRIGIPMESGKYEKPDSYWPTSVAVAPDGRMFVADGYGLSWIHRYDKEGQYLGSFGGRGDQPENLRTPHGLWLDNRGDTSTLLVADRENHRIVRFSLDGEFIEGTDSESGMLRRPCHIQFRGNLGIVADLSGRVTLLNEKLELVTQLGDNPDESQRANFGVQPDKWRDGTFLAPHCARIDSKGNILVMDWNVAGRITRLERLARLTQKK